MANVKKLNLKIVMFMRQVLVVLFANTVILQIKIKNVKNAKNLVSLVMIERMTVKNVLMTI